MQVLFFLTKQDPLNNFLSFSPKQHNNYITITCTTQMFNFPFLNLLSKNDSFDYPLASHYDPSYPIQTQQVQPPKPDLPKLEEGTSPGYVKQQPIDVTPIIYMHEKKCKTPKNEKQKTKIKIKNTDDDFKPYDRKKMGKGITKQKQDRNLIPNTVHHLLAFVQKQFKSCYLVEQIFKGIPHNPDYTVARFYTYHKMLRTKINNYVNEGAMKIITQSGSLDYSEYDEDQQKFYTTVCRILIRRFFKVEAVLMILLSKKVRKQNILDHLNVQRYLFQNMRATYQV